MPRPKFTLRRSDEMRLTLQVEVSVTPEMAAYLIARDLTDDQVARLRSRSGLVRALREAVRRDCAMHLASDMYGESEDEREAQRPIEEAVTANFKAVFPEIARREW